MSKTKVLADSVLGESLLPDFLACRKSPFYCVYTWWGGVKEEREREGKNDGERKFLVSSHKTLIPLWGPHLMISSKPMYIPPPKPHLIMKQRTNLTPYWSYCFSSNLCALFPGLTPAGSAPWKGMPPTA